jgi:tRNA(fMet)-specific endonuclease VapC
MGRYLLDTNIILGYLRSSPFAEHVERTYGPFSPPNVCGMSVVSRGELISLSYRHGWDENRKAKLKDLVKKIPQLDINNDAIFEMYGEIEAYSQGHHPTKRLPISARNMSKNDLWIAATTSVARATLITTDADFDHLDRVFFPLIKIDPKARS